MDLLISLVSDRYREYLNNADVVGGVFKIPLKIFEKILYCKIVR